MPRGKRLTTEQIITNLRQVEVILATGRSVDVACKEIGVTPQSYYRWRKEYGDIRSDNGPEFTSEFIRDWLNKIGVETLFIMPGSPWENGYNESFNGTLRDEILNREIFDTLLEARVLIERWRIEYNTIRPHSSLGYRPPAPETYRQNQIGIAMQNVS